MTTTLLRYVILDMNANGKTSTGMAEKQKDRIAHVLRSENPLVVCVQEFRWVGIHSPAWEGFGIPDHFRYEGKKEAGFIFDTREITYSRIHKETSKDTIYDTKKGKKYCILSRLCVCKMTRLASKGAPNFEILCASWHGPHKVSRDKKEKALDMLVKFLLKLKAEENLPLLLGGDFNMLASDVKNKLKPDDSLMLHTPRKRSIDMFVTQFDKDAKFSKVETLSSISAFDHLHLKIYLTVVNDTNTEEQKGMKEVKGAENKMSKSSEQTSPSEVESKQKTKGQKGMKEVKGAENKMPKSPEQTSPPRVDSKQKTKGPEGMKEVKGEKS